MLIFSNAFRTVFLVQGSFTFLDSWIFILFFRLFFVQFNTIYNMIYFLYLILNSIMIKILLSGNPIMMILRIIFFFILFKGRIIMGEYVLFAVLTRQVRFASCEGFRIKASFLIFLWDLFLGVLIARMHLCEQLDWKY